MTNELEKQFFDTFGIEPITHAVWDSTETKWKNFESWEEYPPITDSILLGLEEIFAHKKINGAGFFDGFHVEKHDDYWIYQLTYYKGGYYTCGFGKTRKEAFLNQLITILNDKEVEEKEKQLVKHQVRTLFEER